MKNSYYLSKVIAYAQGFAMMKKAGEEYGWNLNIEEIASIFRAGCIIQADFLEVIMNIYKNNPKLDNLLLDSGMENILKSTIDDLRFFNIEAIKNAIPIPTITSAITYIDQLKSELLGANMIQAQRDFFGAHTFNRTDMEGVYHNEWE